MFIITWFVVSLNRLREIFPIPWWMLCCCLDWTQNKEVPHFWQICYSNKLSNLSIQYQICLEKGGYNVENILLLVLITWHSSCKATKLTISYLVYPLLWKDWKLCIMLWMSIFVLHDTTNFTDQQTFRYYAPESTIWQICSNFAGKPESILQFAESVESYMLLYTLWQWLKSLWIFPSSCKVVSGIKF